MIQLRTILEISDNTGAQKGQCLKVYNKSNKNIGTIGNVFLVSIKKVKNKNKSKKIYKKELHKAILIRTKKKINRYDGSSIKFNINSAILLKKELQKNVYYPIDTRIFGPIVNELKIFEKKNFKILSISSKTF